MVDLFRVTGSPMIRRLLGDPWEPDEDGRVYIGQGARVDLFEKVFAIVTGLPAWDDLRWPLGVNSASAAIDLALHQIGVGAGDEVIATPITCTASNGPVVTRGASLAWADVDPITGNMEPYSLSRLITPRTKAIIAVDWGGRSCDYNRIRWLTEGAIPIIQDAAHRLYIDPDNCGDYVAWSFGPIKHLTTGGYGGALLPPRAEHERTRELRWHGLDRRNSGLPLRAADPRGWVSVSHDRRPGDRGVGEPAAGDWGCCSGERERQLVQQRPGWRAGLIVPPFDPRADYWFFTVLTTAPYARDSLKVALGKAGIASSQVHARNDEHPAFMQATARQYGALESVASSIRTSWRSRGGGCLHLSESRWWRRSGSGRKLRS